jgi:hypothetical protein
MPLYQFVVADISEELTASHLQGQSSLRLKNKGSMLNTALYCSRRFEPSPVFNELQSVSLNYPF